MRRCQRGFWWEFLGDAHEKGVSSIEAKEGKEGRKCPVGKKASLLQSWDPQKIDKGMT